MQLRQAEMESLVVPYMVIPPANDKRVLYL